MSNSDAQRPRFVYSKNPTGRYHLINWCLDQNWIDDPQEAHDPPSDRYFCSHCFPGLKRFVAALKAEGRVF